MHDTLCFMSHERDVGTVLPIACALSCLHEWPEICFDTLWKIDRSLFFIFWQLQLFSRGFKAYRYFIYEKMAVFLYGILCFSGSQILLKCKRQKKQ